MSLWKAVVYADTEESHLDAWAYLLEQFPEQEAIISYLISMWLPWRRQFVSCWISKIRNFGVRVTSRTEANRREIKGYLMNSSADLKHLVERVELMISRSRRLMRHRDSLMTTVRVTGWVIHVLDVAEKPLSSFLVSTVSQ